MNVPFHQVAGPKSSLYKGREKLSVTDPGSLYALHVSNSVKYFSFIFITCNNGQHRFLLDNVKASKTWPSFMCVSLFDCTLGRSPDVIETLCLMFLFMAYTEHHLLGYRAQNVWLCAKGESVCVKMKKNLFP